MATYRRRVKATFDEEQGVFMISVAAELADMHPQTLRMYETRGLIEPQRSPKGTRLYSQADVDRLRRIQEMTTELGLNLAGVERVLALEEELEREPPPGGARAPLGRDARGDGGRAGAGAQVAEGRDRPVPRHNRSGPGRGRPSAAADDPRRARPVGAPPTPSDAASGAASLAGES